MAMIRVSVPGFRKVGEGQNNFTVFNIEVYVSGRIHHVEKRYTEFEELHKQLKKVIRTPEFPPKKVLRFNNKVLEHRRLGLQTYLQGILEGETIPKSLLKFLDASLATITGTCSIDNLDQVGQEPSITHQPMIGFTAEAFLQDTYRSMLPDIVAEGVHMGLYGPVDQDAIIS